MNTLHATAIELHAGGIRVIPVRADKSKAPALKAWQNHATTREDINTWFGGDNPRYTAIGAVMGAVSLNLELTEIEGPYAHRLPEIKELADASGLGDLWDRINRGWVEISPSGGVHWFTKIDGATIPGNTKIAQTADHATIAETRGTGGQVVIAPTGGHAHPTGKPWVRVNGPTALVTITAEEREQFHALLATLDERPQHTTPSTETNTGWQGVLADLEAGPTGPAPIEGETPGDDYETKTTWADILTPAGWTKVFTRGTTTYWRRPGKNIGFSATTGHANDRDRLYVFSSSTEFPTNEPITKFGAYAIMNHGGDHAKAASKLRKTGYGAPLPDNTRPPRTTTAPAAAAATSQDGAEPSTDQFPATTITGTPTRHWNDLGLRSHWRLAARLAQHATNKLIYVTGSGWHHWTGTHWAYDPRGQKAHQTLTDLLKNSWIEAADDKDLANDVKACMSATGTKGVLELASRLPQLATDHVDQDPYILNTPAGTLDLHTLETRPHNPTDLITKITRASYDPTANNKRWTDFLNSSLPDPEVQQFLQRYIGVSLIGKTVEELLVVMTGDGRNGKGTIYETILTALGDYAITANNQLLVSGRYQGQSAGEKSSLMRLRGARLAFMSELDEGTHLAQATMKALTGGDHIEAKYMGQDAVQFEPSHNLLMLTNDLPKVSPTAQAVWMRMRVVPFTESFDGDKADKNLKNDLKLAIDAVLTWCIDGLRQYQLDGLQAPDAVMARTETYRNDNDPVAMFLEDECVTHVDAKVTRHTLYHAYTEWAREQGVRAMSANKFAPRIRSVPGVGTTTVHGVRQWLGIGLKSEDGGIEEPDPWQQLPTNDN